MVEHIQHFRLQRKANALGDRNLFGDRHIIVEEVRSEEKWRQSNRSGCCIGRDQASVGAPASGTFEIFRIDQIDVAELRRSPNLVG